MLTLALLVSSRVTGAEPDATRNQSVDLPSRHGVVAADHELASAAGAQMLRRGGNVVDAAVATAFCLSVLRPEGCGIGGGGFMVIWDAEQRRGIAIDFRERAPVAATREMFRPTDKQADPPPSQAGGLAVAVPGEVAGLLHALEHYGTLDRETVLAPAIALASQELPVDAQLRAAQRETIADFNRVPSLKERFPELWKTYLNSGTVWSETASYRSPLGDVLQRIADEGRDGFYEGEVAAAIVAEVRRHSGIMTVDDLKEIQPVVERQPLRVSYGKQELLTMPPPSSGGIAQIEVLGILRAWEEAQPSDQKRKTVVGLGHNSVDYVHLITEALKHAFADRAEFLGDADFSDVPTGRLISAAHAKRLASRIDMTHTLKTEEYGRFQPVGDGGTSHFSVIDEQGNAVACTLTINTHFGSYVMEPKFGIMLNNEMDDFAAVPGVPNAFGLIQSERNSVAPGKKPLSSMSPTIVLRDGKAIAAAGGSGGPRIISATLQVLLNMLLFEMDADQAVTAPRFHHQWLPDELLLEPALYKSIGAALQQRGHKVKNVSGLAATQAVQRSKEKLSGGSDPRKGGRPVASP